MMRASSYFSLCCLAFVMLVGCESKTSSRLKELNGTQIQRLVNCYSFYQTSHGYRGPKDEAEFREFLSDSQHKDAFERVGIDVNDLDSLFVSERDGKPYKIKYGLKGSMVGFFEAVVFETEGVDGEVMVGFGGAKAESMSLEDSNKLFDSEVKESKKDVVRENFAG